MPEDEDEEAEELAVVEKPDPSGQPPFQDAQEWELLQELEAARASLDQYDGQAPPSAFIRLGRVCLAIDRLDEARGAAKEALMLFKELGDSAGIVSAQTLLCDVHLQAMEMEEAIAVASRALVVCKDIGDKSNTASVLSKKAVALNNSGMALEALRTAEQATRAWRQVGDPGGDVEAFIAAVEAQVAICEERGTDLKVNGLTVSHLNVAKAAVKAAQTWRPEDHGCLGAAFLIHARMCVHLGNWKHAEKSARGASKAFRKARQASKRAQALVIWAEADLHRGYLQDARVNASRAQDIFQSLGDQDGLSRVGDVYDGVDRALGIPTAAELAARQQQQMLMAQQQAYMQSQQAQQQQASPGAGAQPLQFVQSQDQGPAEVGKKQGGGEVVSREGVPLDIGSMVNEEVVSAKIMEVVKALLGDDDDEEELDPEVPLMEAGMTSNNAVLMRDYLQKDMPGVNLPPTLIFDYPSVNAIAEFIVERSLAIKG